MGGGQDGARGQLASQCVDQVIDSEKGSARNPTLGMGDTSVSANPIKIIIVLEGGATKQVLTFYPLMQPFRLNLNKFFKRNIVNRYFLFIFKLNLHCPAVVFSFII